MTHLARSTLLLLLFTLVVVASPALPVGLPYVVSDSMAPTIGVDDGVVRVPAGDVEPGDIVVFESPTRDQRFTVHRVVEETPRGFVTKGDNSDVTDQAAGAPHVQRSEIRGAVLTVGGTPFVVPNLGSVIEHRTFLLALVAALGLLDLATASTGGRPARPTTAGQLLTLMVAISSAVLVVTVVLGGSTGHVAFAAVDGSASAPTTVPAGEAVTRTVEVRSGGRSPFTYVAVDTASTTVLDRTWNESTLSLTLRVPPQPPATSYRTTMRVHRYPLVLPPSVIDDAHAVHPLLAAGATTGALVVPLYALGWLVIVPQARLRRGASLRRAWRRRLDRVFG